MLLLGLGFFLFTCLFSFFFSWISTVNWWNKPQRVQLPLSLSLNSQQRKHILPMYSHLSNILPRCTEFLSSDQNQRKVKWFAWSHTRDPWLRSPETRLSHCSVQWATGSQTAFLGYPHQHPVWTPLHAPSTFLPCVPACRCLLPSSPRSCLASGTQTEMWLRKATTWSSTLPPWLFIYHLFRTKAHFVS